MRKGQLIAEIDDQPQRSDLRNAQAALSVAQADLQTRQATLVRQQAQFQRLQQMVKTNAVSRRILIPPPKRGASPGRADGAAGAGDSGADRSG